jgi:hypothetical protein
MRFLLTATCFILLIIWHSNAFSQAIKGIFYQPLTRDAVVTEAQWQSLLIAIKSHGISHFVLQWSEYEDVRFTDKGQVMDTLIDLLQKHHMTWSVGLKMPHDYYAIMEHGSAEEKQASLARWFNQNRLLMMRLTVAGYAKRQGFTGWYLPLEVSEAYIDDVLLKLWQAGISGLINETSHPIAVSYFPAAYGDTSLFSQFYSAVNDPQLEIMVQLSNGLIDAPRRLQNISLPCNVSIIVENFTQISKEKLPFLATKSELPKLISNADCQDFYVFSLRYQPYSHHLPLQD